MMQFNEFSDTLHEMCNVKHVSQDTYQAARAGAEAAGHLEACACSCQAGNLLVPLPTTFQAECSCSMVCGGTLIVKAPLEQALVMNHTGSTAHSTAKPHCFVQPPPALLPTREPPCCKAFTTATCGSLLAAY